MKLIKNAITLAVALGFSVSIFADYNQINVHVNQTPFITQIAPEPPSVGAMFGQGLAQGFSQGMTIGMMRAMQEGSVSDTKNKAIISWVGGPKLICKQCYEQNLPLKQRVEMTTLIALELQKTGYGVADSIETAKTMVQINMGNCQINACCQQQQG